MIIYLQKEFKEKEPDNLDPETWKMNGYALEDVRKRAEKVGCGVYIVKKEGNSYYIRLYKK
jgi:hypothetical protein